MSLTRTAGNHIYKYIPAKTHGNLHRSSSTHQIIHLFVQAQLAIPLYDIRIDSHIPSRNTTHPLLLPHIIIAITLLNPTHQIDQQNL